MVNVENWQEFDQTGIPVNLFNGCVTGPTNEKLKSEITKFRFGCIFDKVPVNGLEVQIQAQFLLDNEEINVVEQLKVRERNITESLQYYSYIKEELQRLQTNNEQSSFLSLNRNWRDTNQELNQRIEAQKRVIINLSTATNLLSPLTAFVGVKLVPTFRPQIAQPEDRNPAPVQVDHYQEEPMDPLDIHGFENNTQDERMDVDNSPAQNNAMSSQFASGYTNRTVRTTGMCGAAAPSGRMQNFQRPAARKNLHIEGELFKS